jgi:hypothetical protein
VPLEIEQCGLGVHGVLRARAHPGDASSGIEKNGTFGKRKTRAKPRGLNELQFLSVIPLRKRTRRSAEAAGSPWFWDEHRPRAAVTLNRVQMQTLIER